MSETTCPCCGGKCVQSKPYYMTALSPPDLTKLRKVFEKWEDTIPNTSNILYPTFANIVLPDIWQAVKELLEENKP